MTAKPKDEGEHTASGIAKPTDGTNASKVTVTFNASGIKQKPSKDAAIAVSHADLADLCAAVEAELLDEAKTIAARFKL